MYYIGLQKRGNCKCSIWQASSAVCFVAKQFNKNCWIKKTYIYIYIYIYIYKLLTLSIKTVNDKRFNILLQKRFFLNDCF